MGITMNTRIYYIIFTFVILIIQNVNSQNTWVKTYGGDNHDIGQSIISTNDGNYIFVGKTNSDDQDFQGMKKGGEDICVVKIDTYGNIVWKKLFGGWLNEHGICIVETPDTNLLVIGNTTSNDGDFGGMNNGRSDIFIMKLNMYGNVIWKKIVGGSEDDKVRHLTSTKDGGFIITGFTKSNDGDFKGLIRDSVSNRHGDMYLVKFDSEGNVKWKKSYGGTQYDEGVSILELDDNGFIITGNSSSSNIDVDVMNSRKGNIDIVLFKIDSIGNIQWNISFGGGLDEGVYSMIKTINNEIVLTGVTNSNDQDFRSMNKGGEDLFIIKFDTTGKLLWKKTFGGTDHDRYSKGTSDINGNITITGTTRSNDGEFKGLDKEQSWLDMYVLSVDKMGELRWIKMYGNGYLGGGYCFDQGNDIIHIENEGYIIIGETNSNEGTFNGLNKSGKRGGTLDIFVMKLDSNGNLNNTTSIKEFSEPTTTLSVHPNPFHNSTTISYKVESPSNVRIELLNTLGQTIEVLREDYTDIGTYQLPLNVSTLSSGMYSVRLRSGSMNEVVPVWVVR